MSDSRSWLEAIERCISVMVFYHNARRSREVDRWMADELRSVAGGIGGQGVSPEVSERRLIRSVEEALIERFGHEVGPRLASILAEAMGPAGPRARRAGSPKGTPAFSGHDPVLPRT